MEKKLDIDEVIVEIPSGEQKSKTGEMEASKSNNIQVDEEEVQGLRSRKKGPVYLSTEIPKKNNGVISTSQQVDDPEKPKSRFAEQEKPKSVDDWKIGGNNDQVTTTTSPKVTPPVTPPRTPTMASPTYDDVDADIYHKERRKKNKLLFVIEVVVEEVSILTTIFLRHDNEKIFYPNSELATKSISNFNRSPEMMETVEFNLDGNTSVEKISHLKVKIKKYIEYMPHLWRPKHSIRVREIQGLDKMTLRLYVTHTINFQDYGEKSERRSDLMLELKHIFDDLGLKYHILPPTSSD